MHGKVTAHPHNSVPAPLHERLALLQYFTEYMDEHLTEGGDVKHQSQVAAASRHKSTVPHMKRWVRTNTAIIMELCNGTLQVCSPLDNTRQWLRVGCVEGKEDGGGMCILYPAFVQEVMEMKYFSSVLILKGIETEH